ncbi:DUF4262 domain-containing protein [Mycolicibacterium litorale]|uniref:DUF4262 domain-containing protein n=1 Tax=Mycolicibacterium litorale TaxID=758802 RepID=UPI003CEFA91F
MFRFYPLLPREKGMSDPERMLAATTTKGAAMCWQCDHPEATASDYLDLVYGRILRKGWTVQYVESEPTPFAYTIGLHDCGLPELLITAVDPQRALLVLNTVAEYCIAHDGPVLPGDFMTLPDQLIEFVEVSQPDAHMGIAIAIYGRDVRALQLVWADADFEFPWSAAFNPGGVRQPVLGQRETRCPLHRSKPQAPK